MKKNIKIDYEALCRAVENRRGSIFTFDQLAFDIDLDPEYIYGTPEAIRLMKEHKIFMVSDKGYFRAV